MQPPQHSIYRDLHTSNSGKEVAAFTNEEEDAVRRRADRWVEVKDRLPLLKQKKYYKFTRYGYARGDEAVNYVENIRRYYDTLAWMDNKSKESVLPPSEIETVTITE